MADEFTKLKKEFEKQAEAWLKNVDVQSDKVVKFVNDSTKDFQTTMKNERKKMELRSEIGEHRRALNRAYTRLGEAYYDAQTSRTKEMSDVSDIMVIVQNNRRLIELLEGQLAELEGTGK
ncbi:MAG: hypothetical protein IKG00_08915 [Lachnospiraceae bacterium]|nr:hypothetical protein [Solobacterium sp.]MBR3309999.1 hypothetical protein [Lachnospiraceae bacterium]